jgi:hypothetical protein
MGDLFFLTNYIVMKKFIIVLIMFLLTIPLFSNNQQIVINAHILPTEPIFLMKASLDADTGYVDGSLNSETDISQEDIEVYIKLYQTNRARIFARYLLTVSANALAKDEDNKTAAPTIVQLDKFITNADLSVTGDTTELTLQYIKGKPFQPFYGLVNAGEIALFKATWTAKEDLAAGTYTSNITLTYTAM